MFLDEEVLKMGENAHRSNKLASDNPFNRDTDELKHLTWLYAMFVETCWKFNHTS